MLFTQTDHVTTSLGCSDAVRKGGRPLTTAWMSDNSSVLTDENLGTALTSPYLSVKSNVLLEGATYVFFVAQYSPRDQQVGVCRAR
jgi:hypothetical protein